MRIILLAVLALVSGHVLAEAQIEPLQCLKELEKDARFSSIAKQVVLDGQDATNPRMLDDGSSPDERQKQAIADWIDARSLCVNRNPVKRSVDLHILFLSVVPDLYNGQATFGEFNKKWHALFKEVTEAPITAPDPTAHHHHH